MKTTVIKQAAGRQRGMALVVALMILVVISVMGIAAMRTSIFNARITASSQGAVMSFQAAESALAALFTEISADPEVVKTIISNAYLLGVITPEERCVTRDNLYKTGACANADFFDERELLKAGSRMAVNPTPRICATGEPVRLTSAEPDDLFASEYCYDIVAVGEGSLDALNIANFNVQELEFKP